MMNEGQFIDLVRLEQLAESATKGEWKCAKRRMAGSGTSVAATRR